MFIVGRTRLGNPNGRERFAHVRLCADCQVERVDDITLFINGLADGWVSWREEVGRGGDPIWYVLELLRSVGDQRATETAHRAWLLTYRDRADAIAEIRVLLAHAEELAEL